MLQNKDINKIAELKKGFTSPQQGQRTEILHIGAALTF